MEHAELPWKAGDRDTISGKYNDSNMSQSFKDGFWAVFARYKGTGAWVACAEGIVSEADARFIVKACNSHYNLLEACKLALAFETQPCTGIKLIATDLPNILRAAIAKAE